MTDGSGTATRQEVLHGTFTVERDLAAPPGAVYAAYADAAVRRRWFRMPGDPARGHYELDFRVGGHEAASGVFAPTGEAEENCAVMVAEQVRDFLENGNIRNSVNYPEAVLPRIPNTTRLAIANSNVPNMVGQISTCLASSGINIADLLNKSRGEYAYTLIDADGALGQELLAELAGIEGVLSARIL